uniref:stress response protein NST1-like n=1 Tax=Erigeron canadensis TaxID=72917 RepID=UPI001CB9B288|nr:stress response protein NST1-like [Erigeron canadensis]XP_043606114.1 stress response protein NST1-like [Erigeron canadensis]
MTTLRRCRNNIESDNIVLIDVDTYNYDNVIVIDVPENLTKLRGSVDKSRPKRTYILIDDDESPSAGYTGANVDSERNFENGASSSRRYGPDISPVKLSTGKRTYSRRGFSAHLESESSDDESPDCEYMEDFSGKLKEEWEKASLKRKADIHKDHGGRKNNSSSSRPSEDALNDLGLNKNKQKHSKVYNFKATCHEKNGESSFRNEKAREHNFSDCDRSDNIDVDGGSNDKYKYAQAFNFKATYCEEKTESFRSENSRKDDLSDHDTADNLDAGKDDLPAGEMPIPQDENMVETDGQRPSISSEGETEKDDLENAATIDDIPTENSIIDQREKHKETEEYKRALEEELSARQMALKIQAEEAQNLRRMQKRKKAESLRLLDMEKRQKQRVEEIRETQKKDEENMNLKEKYRTEFREKLKKLEITCLDMASLLRGLGIQVGNGHVPLSHEVRAAYKRALLSFHPDRASGSDMRQQVESEEKFKLISRMKEKLSL